MEKKCDKYGNERSWNRRRTWMESENKLKNNATVLGFRYNYRSAHADIAIVGPRWETVREQSDKTNLGVGEHKQERSTEEKVA